MNHEMFLDNGSCRIGNFWTIFVVACIVFGYTVKGIGMIELAIKFNRTFRSTLPKGEFPTVVRDIDVIAANT